MDAIITSAAFAAFISIVGNTVYKEIERRRERRKTRAEKLYSVIRPALDNSIWHYLIYTGTDKGVNEHSLQWFLTAFIYTLEASDAGISEAVQYHVPPEVKQCLDAWAKIYKQHTTSINVIQSRMPLTMFLGSIVNSWQKDVQEFRNSYTTIEDQDPVSLKINKVALSKDIAYINKELGLRIKLPLPREEKFFKKFSKKSNCPSANCII